MTIIRNRRKDRSFIMLDNACIQDERLSWRARGLLHYLLSLPVDWVINVQDLINRAPDGRDAVYSIIKELRQVGYIRHERQRGNQGTLTGAQYHVFEVPESDENNEDVTPDIPAETEEVCPEQDLPSVVEPEWCEPDREKPDTYNIHNIQNTQHTKETAAAAAVSQNNNSFEQPEKTEKVEITFTNHDVLITNKLTPYQHMRVSALAAHMISHVPYLIADELAKQIAESLISQQSFSRCGRDFHRKLNAIQKTILKGGWTPPIEIAERALQEKEQKLQQHKKNLATAISDLNHWQNMQDFAKSSSNEFEVARIEKLIQTHKDKIRQLQQLQQQEEDATIE